jgi:hypothetical protein
MSTMNAFSKEVSRFALMSKKECIQDLMESDADDTYKTVLQAKMDELDQQIAKVGKGGKSDKPRTLNAYNHFVKAKLPEIAKEKPELDNRARMKEVSELWKAMTQEEKAAFAAA